MLPDLHGFSTWPETGCLEGGIYTKPLAMCSDEENFLWWTPDKALKAHTVCISTKYVWLWRYSTPTLVHVEDYGAGSCLDIVHNQQNTGWLKPGVLNPISNTKEDVSSTEL